jgi:hypothetical protein
MANIIQVAIKHKSVGTDVPGLLIEALMIGTNVFGIVSVSFATRRQELILTILFLLTLLPVTGITAYDMVLAERDLKNVDPAKGDVGNVLRITWIAYIIGLICYILQILLGVYRIFSLVRKTREELPNN